MPGISSKEGKRLRTMFMINVTRTFLGAYMITLYSDKNNPIFRGLAFKEFSLSTSMYPNLCLSQMP
jgi:hypothetical protein